MITTEDGLLVFARRPCRTGCSHADEAFHPDELERERSRSRRALLPAEEAEIVRLFRPRDGASSSNVAALADRFRVTTRTVYRILRRAGGRALCPGADGRGCAVETPGGRLCGYCKRTEELASR